MAWSYDNNTDIYTVPYDELDDLLNTLVDNTIQTAYKINITDFLGSEIVAPYPLRNKIKNHLTKFVDLSVTTFPALVGFTDFNSGWTGCSNLVKTFAIPDGVTNLQSCFSGCSSLIALPHIPATVTNYSNVCNGCISLTKAFIPSSVTVIKNAFFECSNLSEVRAEKDDYSGISATDYANVFSYCNSLSSITVPSSTASSTLKTLLTTEQNQGRFPSGININTLVSIVSWSYDETTGVWTVPFTDLDSMLNSFSQNTADTPYKVNITGLVATDLTPASTSSTISPLARKLSISGDIDKYVDLTPTTLPSATNLRSCFFSCENLVESPALPSNANSLEDCFNSCRALKHSPVIPSSVRNMLDCFAFCNALLEVPEIPSGVTNMYCCFYQCLLITTTPTIPTTVTDIRGCFAGCTSLVTVTNIPAQTTYIANAFSNCTALKTIYNWRYNSISTNDTYSGDCFTDCNALEQIFIDEFNNSRRNSLVTFLTNRQTNGYFPSGKTVVDMVFYPYTEGFSIAFSNLDNYLTYIPQNTASTPYKLTITGLSVGNVNTSTTTNSLGYVIKNRAKYLDLSLTTLNASQTTMVDRFNGCETLVVPPTIPVNVTTMERCFLDCDSLISAPNFDSNTKITEMRDCFCGCESLTEVENLPPNTTSLFGTFYGCTSLEEAPVIPETVTTMAGTFFGCTSLEEAPEIPNSVTILGSTFQGCTSLDKAPVIPNSVTNMADTFAGCTSIEIAPVIPDSVDVLQDCFMNCTSLVDVPSLPELNSQLSDISHCFDGCTALKRVNFNGTFDLTNADFDVIFNDCDALESVFVKSSANKTALITELETQQNNGDFPSSLIVANIVKFDEKVMKVQTEEGTEIVDLYRFKGQLLTEKNGELVYADEDFKPFSVQIDNETFFAQTIPESLLATCRNKGSGTVLKKKVGTEIIEGVTTPVYQWFTKSAGTLDEPFQRKYTELDVYTSDASNIVIPKENFPKGGVLLLCGGAGESKYRDTQQDGGKGGDGQIIRVEIPANPKEDITIANVEFTKTSTDGTRASYSRREYYSTGSGAYATCTSSNTTQYGYTGGVGGSDCTVTILKNGVSQSVTAYGGGGGGGTWVDIWRGYTDASGSSCRSWRTYSGSQTTGGTSGNGAVTTNQNGADATEDGLYEGNESTTAKLIVGAYV